MAMGPYSDSGKARLKIYAALYSVNIVVLALSTRVNQFQEFFFAADLFPFSLSIMTFILLSASLLLDFSLRNPFTSCPPFEIGFLAVLTVFWLAFNAFSMSRWQHVPLACNAMIPDEFTAERAWCRDLQALKAFVWIEWVILFVTTFLTARFVVREHARGNTHVWSTSLAAYEPRYYNSASAFPFESRNGKGAGAGARADYAFDGTGNEGMHRRTSSFFSGFGSRRNGNITDTGATVAPSETGANPSAHASFVDFGREWRPRSWAL